MNPDPIMVRGSVRAYGWMLRLYPAAHRDRFGAEMIQVFRDCCRDALRASGAWGVAALWIRLLPELCTTAAGEHLAAWKDKRRMKRISPLIKASNWMLLAGVAAGLLSSLFHQVPWAIITCAGLTGLLIVGHAVTSWGRPTTHWWRMLLAALFVFVYYGLLAPMWAKLLEDSGLEFRSWMPALIFIPLGACLVAAVLKSAQCLWVRAHRTGA